MGTISFASGLTIASGGANQAKFAAFINSLAQAGVGGYTPNGYDVSVVSLDPNTIGVNVTTPTLTEAGYPDVAADLQAAATSAGLTPDPSNVNTFGYFSVAGAGNGNGGGGTGTGMTKASNTPLIIGAVVVGAALIGLVAANASKKRRRGK